MYKQQYEDYKYVMQDTYQVYLGAKYSLQEVVENEEIPFKCRLLMERYVCAEVDSDTTLESHFYYLTGQGMLFRLYRQVKTKVKINIIEEKKSLFGKKKKQYTTRILPVDQLVKMTPQEKERQGVVIQEIIMSKLALMTF